MKYSEAYPSSTRNRGDDYAASLFARRMRNAIRAQEAESLEEDSGEDVSDLKYMQMYQVNASGYLEHVSAACVDYTKDIYTREQFAKELGYDNPSEKILNDIEELFLTQKFSDFLVNHIGDNFLNIGYGE